MCRAVVLQEESGKWVRDLECSVETIFKMDLPIPLPETVRVTGEQVETACHVLNLQVVYTDSPPSLVPCETRGTTDFWEALFHPLPSLHWTYLGHPGLGVGPLSVPADVGVSTWCLFPEGVRRGRPA